jgi:hypothetical protein
MTITQMNGNIQAEEEGGQDNASLTITHSRGDKITQQDKRT